MISFKPSAFESDVFADSNELDKKNHDLQFLGQVFWVGPTDPKIEKSRFPSNLVHSNQNFSLILMS